MTETDDQLAADLRAAVRDLSDDELAEQAYVFAGVREHLDGQQRRHQARLHDVLVAICAAERRRRRAEVKQLELAWRAGEPPSAWWGSDDLH